jgi:Holliday junction resolvase
MVQSRAPKLLGDFGEGLVTYALIRKGFEVANVDHVGADLVAEKDGKRFAVSVKTRLFRPGSKESLNFVVEKHHIDKLKHFATQFDMTPLFALALCLSDERTIHLLVIPATNLTDLPEAEHGVALRFSRKARQKLLQQPFVDYSCWKDETIGTNDFA